MKVNNVKRFAALAAFLAGLSAPVFGLEVLNNDKAELNVGGRMQLFGFGQSVQDPHRNDGRVYLFMKQSRLKFWGRVEDYKYNVEMAMGGEEEVANKNASLSLLDMSVDMPLTESVFARVGQFKVPSSREALASSGRLHYTNRSVQHLAFRSGRDVGVAVHASRGSGRAVAGVFTGGGRDVPERYLPQKLGFPLVSLRAGFDNGVDPDAFTADQDRPSADGVKSAVYVNGLYTKDSLVGHSSVLGVKTAEKSLLINSNWNPFIARSPLDRGDLWQAGADAALRMPLGSFVFGAEIEGNHAEFRNVYGTIAASGGRAQVSLSRDAVEVAVRYAAVWPDGKLAYYDSVAKKSYALMDKEPIQEITPALTFHLKRSHAKVILDVPVLVDVPVVIEKGVGTYVLTEQPDQTSYAKNRVERQTVVEARMLFQLGF